ncbi:hypothetical protein DEJ45_08325 [Streptomyces venezuelae]|nr:hypothetical protein DEJ45_08325 [Streptomyces venezuelae]
MDPELLARRSAGGDVGQVEGHGVQGSGRTGLDGDLRAAVGCVGRCGTGGAGGLDAGGQVAALGDVGEAPVDRGVRRVRGHGEAGAQAGGAAHVDGDETGDLRAAVGLRGESVRDPRSVSGRSGQWLRGEGDHGLAVRGPGLHLGGEAGRGTGGRDLIVRGQP